MGKAPTINTQSYGSDFLQVGKDEILEALESTFTAVLEGSMTSEDCCVVFKNAKCNKQYGSSNGSPVLQSSDGKALHEMVDMVRSAFQAVENGSLTEGEYYFELSTEYFTFESGEYPLNDEDGCSSSSEKQEPVASWQWFRSLSLNTLSTKHPLLDMTMRYEVTSANMRHKIMQIMFSTRIVLHVIVAMAMSSSLIVPTAASPIHAAEHPLTLTAGRDETIPFVCSNDHQFNMPKYYTVTFKGKDRPFYVDGTLDPEGLMSPDQADRFSVEYIENESKMSIEIHIASVSLHDQGTYIVMVIISGETLEPRLMQQVVMIYIPPGPAACFIQPSTIRDAVFEIHCHAKRGNGNSTLACFQSGAKIPYRGTGGQIVYRRIFWYPDAYSPVSCCAHDIKEIETITESECNQFKYPHSHDTIHPDPTKPKITKMAPVTTSRPSSNDDENESSSPNKVHSGCAQSYNVRRTAMLPLLTILSCVYIFSI